LVVTRRHPRVGNPFKVHIDNSREDSIVTHDEDTANIKIYADGSGLDGEAGAAAALFRGNLPPTVLRYHLGPLTKFTTSDSEAVGVLLGMHLLRQETNVTLVSVSIDISATNIRKPQAGQHIILGFLEQADEERKRSGAGLSLSLRWISCKATGLSS
jgi:hypothetical protein